MTSFSEDRVFRSDGKADSNPNTAQHNAYQPLFTRKHWTHVGQHIDRFFDKFVPMQYIVGFNWRCHVIGGEELKRAKAFEAQPAQVQTIIAGNAELLLELFEETTPPKLDNMRQIGERIVHLQGNGEISFKELAASGILELGVQIGKRHHEIWHEKFKQDLASGERTDSDHPGNKPYAELPPIEMTRLIVQAWANCRILALLRHQDYALIRNFSATHT